MSRKYPQSPQPKAGKNRLRRAVSDVIACVPAISSIFAIALVVLFCLSSVSLAANLPTGQAVEKTATLIGPQENSPIPLYLRPAANQPNVGYGVNGSSVTITEQISGYLPEADQKSAWNHIRLNSPPYTEGWIQGRFLSIPGSASASE